MRRYIVMIIFVIIMSSFFVSCKNESQEIYPPVVNFTSTVEVNQNKEVYIAQVINSENDIAKITIVEPEVISGLNYNWYGYNYSVEYNDLFCQSNVLYISEISFPSVMIDVLNECKNIENLQMTCSDEEIVEYSGESKSGEFVVESQRVNGLINRIEVKGLSLTYRFSNQLINEEI